MSFRNEFYEIVLGILLVFGMHIAAIMVGSIISIGATSVKLYSLNLLLLYALFGIGLSQLLYIIPVFIWLNRQQSWRLMKGVIIGAVITAFLNGSCWLLIFASSR